MDTLRRRPRQSGEHDMVNSRYRVDLRELQALCAANYVRVLRLFPEYEVRNARQFCVGTARVRIDVIERTRYTTVFRLQCLRAAADAEACAAPAAGAEWLSPLRIDARAYHDAGLLEVIDFAGADREGPSGSVKEPVKGPVKQRLPGRHAYPNPAMHQRDEKRQQNRFLAAWLSHCLHHGRADLDSVLALRAAAACTSLRKQALRKPGAEHA